MQKHIIPIFLFTLASLWPVISSAATETTSFTLSVTIPERAGIDQTAVPKYFTSDEPQTIQPEHFQAETATRDDQLVLVRSYVVN